MKPKLKMVDRDAWLLQRAANRIVMHVGCTDTPMIEGQGCY